MTDGFSKIELPENSKKSDSPMAKSATRKSIKNLGRFLIVILIIFIVLGIAIALPARRLHSSVLKSTAIAKESYTAIKNQNIEEASVKLAELNQSLLNVQRDLSKLAWTKYIPVLGAYERDAEHLIKASIAAVSAGEIATETIVPYADLLGLKGKSTFVSGSADERIQKAVETLDKVTPKLSDISVKVAVAGSELDAINPNRYPEKIGSIELRSQLQTAKDLFSEGAKLFVDAQPFLAKLPEVLGTLEKRNYLVIFQNDAEQRATGGFITAYSLFEVDRGKMRVVKSDDIYKLDESKKKKYPAKSPILKYHQNVFTQELRDSNLSPDFVVSMKEFETMLTDSVPDFPKFDGIIALDTHVLVSVIEILGEFNVAGRVFSAENDKRCDCPKAIYELEDYATKPVAYVREERKDIIGTLLFQIMQKALGVSPSQYWGRLFQMFLEEAQQKHVLFYFHDTQAQSGIESINFAGRIVSADRDYLHVNNVNFAGAKSNIFVKESVREEINVGGDGVVTKTLYISYKNPSPPSNCNLEAGQLCLNGILRNWLRVYVPEKSTLLEFTGSEKDTTTYDELGKTVFEGFLTVKPQGSSEVKIVYKLPFKVEKGIPYSLLIQKQPGTDDNAYIVSYNGKKIEEFPLLTDRKLSFK